MSNCARMSLIDRFFPRNHFQTHIFYPLNWVHPICGALLPPGEPNVEKNISQNWSNVLIIFAVVVWSEEWWSSSSALRWSNDGAMMDVKHVLHHDAVGQQRTRAYMARYVTPSAMMAGPFIRTRLGRYSGIWRGHSLLSCEAGWVILEPTVSIVRWVHLDKSMHEIWCNEY